MGGMRCIKAIATKQSMLLDLTSVARTGGPYLLFRTDSNCI